MNAVKWAELMKKGLCGQVRFCDTILKPSSVSVKGISQNGGVRYWDGDFRQVFHEPLRQTLKIHLPDYCHKVTVCDNVFALITHQKVIQVYNKQGQLQDSVIIEGGPVCIEKSPVGDMLVFFHDTGLFILK